MNHEEYYNQLYDSELAEFKKSQAECDENHNIKSKFKSFLSIAGEKKNKETNELYREHIPASVFGVSSDEIASSMGITENELMDKLNNGLKEVSKPKNSKVLYNNVFRVINRQKNRKLIQFKRIFYTEVKKMLLREVNKKDNQIRYRHIIVNDNGYKTRLGKYLNEEKYRRETDFDINKCFMSKEPCVIQEYPNEELGILSKANLFETRLYYLRYAREHEFKRRRR
jgi:hypothetical protein